MAEEGKLERWTGRADIAWCPDHGLHGARTHCFECEKPVEQIPMVPLSEIEPLLGTLRAFAHGPSREPETYERALQLIEQVQGDAADALAQFDQPHSNPQGQGECDGSLSDEDKHRLIEMAERLEEEAETAPNGWLEDWPKQEAELLRRIARSQPQDQEGREDLAMEILRYLDGLHQNEDAARKRLRDKARSALQDPGGCQ